jgi:two-component system cell cycle sensor histidine kinase/response regulator CckA
MLSPANEKSPFLANVCSLAPWSGSLELAIVSDAQGRLMEVNRAFARKFGRPALDWSGQKMEDLVHGEDVAEWRVQYERLHRPPYHISREQRWNTAQGWRWINWEETALRNAMGEIVAMRSVGRDVTKNRLAEEHFRKLSQAVEQAPVSVIMTTLGGIPQYVNSHFTEVSGYTLEDIFEKEIPLLRDGHPTEASYRSCCARLAAGQKWAGELRTRRRDGKETWESVQISPIRNQWEEITYLLCLREDITERKELEFQLRQMQKMESLGTLAGGIAHDFNNIISIVRGFSELALALPDSPPRMERYLKAVHSAALRASALVSQIMLFSRKAEVKHREVRVADVAKELVGFFSETFPRNIDFNVQLDESLADVAADPNQIRQLLVNLCVNARDAMPDGGTLTLTTSRVRGALFPDLHASPDLDYLRISVRDTGVGMSAETKQRVFEPFFTTKGSHGGTGLGLAVVYGIVTNHEGLLTLESEEGHGTEFFVYLPYRPRGESSAEGAGGADAGALAPGTERILLVEDEEPIQEILSIALKDAGYRVEVAGDGEVAVELLLNGGGPYDLVVLDLNMPRLGGIEVLKLLACSSLDVPVIVASGHLTDEVSAELCKLGPADVLPKPYDLHMLGTRIRRILDGNKEA